MLLIYNKDTGTINYTSEMEYNPSSVNLSEDQKVKVSYIEYGSDMQYLYVDPKTEEIKLKHGVIINPNKNQIKINDTVHFTVTTDYDFDSLNVFVGNNIITITAKEFDVTFNYPGIYHIGVQSPEYYALTYQINVI